jgi:hydroxymethylpyrimidine pyrophosphatase-like HAD family hydrolase
LHYHALASDYDGTLATEGRVDAATLAALERLRTSGRKLLLVTGRRLPDLVRIFPQVELCDRVVAENGALLYNPGDRLERALGQPPSPEFIAALEQRRVSPLWVGRVIVASSRSQEARVRDVIQALGLELDIILNKGAIMALPTGLDKATGMEAALLDLGLSGRNVVGVGDAENDLTFLARCGCAVAVANGLDSVKAAADLVTASEHGEGVIELIGRLLQTDLCDVPLRERVAR